MFDSKFISLHDILKEDLCIGCGACVFLTHSFVRMRNSERKGRKPVVLQPLSQSEEQKILEICPGIHLKSLNMKFEGKEINNNQKLVGPILAIYDGWAKDQRIRSQATSGGIISALAIYCLEKEDMELVVHTGKEEITPWINKTVISKTRDNILENSGSKYAPSSPCEFLEEIKKGSKKSVFIGKPCDVAAVHKIRQIDKELDKKLGLVLSFFCSGVSNLNGVKSLANKLKVDLSDIIDLDYRKGGWPGFFTIRTNTEEKKLAHKQAWEVLRKNRLLRCHLCPDGLGAFPKYDTHKT